MFHVGQSIEKQLYISARVSIFHVSKVNRYIVYVYVCMCVSWSVMSDSLQPHGL